MMVGWRVLIVLLLLVAVFAGVSAAMRLNGDAEPHAANQSADEAISTASSATHTPARFEVTIRKPAGPPRVATAVKDIHGGSVTVACGTCHATRPPDHQNKTVKTLDEFHSGMAFSHGTVSCLSCHNAADYDSLQLADGSRIEFTDVMTLCGQCHGPQMKDYEHGAHGGLNGYWDLTRGPQQKNNCVDCHNPHSPQFPKMQPTFKPKDRFLEQSRSQH
jgi:nitrate reductase cytochrome c-type subunit